MQHLLLKKQGTLQMRVYKALSLLMRKNREIFMRAKKFPCSDFTSDNRLQICVTKNKIGGF